MHPTHDEDSASPHATLREIPPASWLSTKLGKNRSDYGIRGVGCRHDVVVAGGGGVPVEDGGVAVETGDCVGGFSRSLK
ncbi:MAG: hypothetical protein K2H72_07950 [Muribaculaceae bacterium]|nr:hypothetical protein [Muribaculaceae bacterium]